MATAVLPAPKPVRVGFAIKPNFPIPPARPQDPEEYFKSPFDPSKHLDQHEMPKRFTMEDLGLGDRQSVSPIGISEPFALFTQEAVMKMRNKVLSDEVWENCRFASSIAACQLRGMAPK